MISPTLWFVFLFSLIFTELEFFKVYVTFTLLNSFLLILQVRGEIGLYRGGSIVFGLSAYPVSEFELVAEELLMSDSVIKVYNIHRVFTLTIFMLFIQIESNGNFK